MMHSCGSMRWRFLAFSMSLVVAGLQSVPVSAADVVVPGDLNLRSARKTAVAPEDLASAVISTGNRQKTVTGGMKLTAAEAVALAQVLQLGSQSLVLSGNGKAVGGSLDLSIAQSLNSLAVPKNVTVFNDFGSNSVMGLSGNFYNAGSFYATSTNSSVTGAIINANNITNVASGLITTVLPAGGIVGAVTNLDLSLVAVNNIVNYGTVSSAGNLNLIAGNSIINASPTGALASLAAVGNINIAAQYIANSGTIAAGTGSINIAEQYARNAELAALAQQVGGVTSDVDLPGFILNNLGGVLEALNGDINVDLGNLSKNSNLYIYGGDLLSNTVNIDAGQGTVYVNVNEMPGTINVNAAASHVVAATENLDLGNFNLSGDPTFFNNGNITLNGNLSYAEGIAVIASGNVVIGANTINAQNGNDITIIAGANFTATGGQQNPNPPTPPDSLLAGTVTVNGGNLVGGNVTCNGCTIQTSGAGGGGNVLIAAYAGSGGGSVTLTDSTINTDATTAGQAGNVTIIAPTSITIDRVSMQGTTGTPTLTISASTPSGSVTADNTGNITGGLAPGALVQGQGTVLLDNVGGSFGIRAPSANVNIGAGSSITVDPSVSIDTAATQTGRAGGSVTLNGLAGISFSNNSSITTDGADGSNGITPVNPGAAGTAGGAGGAGGAVTLTSKGATILLSAGPITVSTTGGDGGDGGDGSTGDQSTPTGGIGGKGGAGGLGGAVLISGTAVTGTLINVGVVSFDTTGGSGGDGGNGGAGFDSGLPGVSGGVGGAGGAGGIGAKGGAVTINGTSDVITADMTTHGGNGGNGGMGGEGGFSNSGTGLAGGAGGIGGAGAIGGMAGNVTITSQQIVRLRGDVLAFSGDGGIGGDGGNGGFGTTIGGKGGIGAIAGAGAAGAVVTATGTQGIVFGDPDGVTAFGTIGGWGGDSSSGGDGGQGNNGAGGAGGAAGAAGVGAFGGTAKLITSAGSIGVEGGNNVLDVFAEGGNSGANNGTGGQGGQGGTVGGIGGKGSNGAVGGKGGTITLSAVAGSITTGTSGLQTGSIQAFGGSSLDGLGDGGGGGDGGSGVGGAGGAGGLGAAGGAGGVVTITARNVAIDGEIALSGGNGSDGTFGGDGGNSTSNLALGGKGGIGGNGGAGGAGGNLTVTASTGGIVSDTDNDNPGSLGVRTLGGDGGDSGSGGSGGDGLSGGAGANAGAGGVGGKGGSIKLTSQSGMNISLLRAQGGDGGWALGDGGNGGNSIGNPAGKGGLGGSGGKAGAGGAGGIVTLLAKTGNITFVAAENEFVIAVDGGFGGESQGAGGDGGAGGNGTGIGGAGGKGSVGGLGGIGGSMLLTASTGTISNGVNGVLQAVGGFGGGAPSVASTLLENPNGGDGGFGGALGGAGGLGGFTGAGATGGKITLTAQAIAGPGIIVAHGGDGGSGLLTGGSGGGDFNVTTTGGAGGNGGNTGAGGLGGIITLKSTVSNVTLNESVEAFGGDSGDLFSDVTGIDQQFAGGGDGGYAVGTGGKGGNAGVTGLGGKGGIINITSAGMVTSTFDLLAPGGDTGLSEAWGGFGGNSKNGVGGTGGGGGGTGNAGFGGSIKIIAKQAITLEHLFVNGGLSGDFVTIGGGGNGGDGETRGGLGGSVIGTGNGGAGGIITVTSTANQVDILGIWAYGRGVGDTDAPGGRGGNADAGNGGDGGIGAKTGNAGKGGTITVSSYTNLIVGDSINGYYVSAGGGFSTDSFGVGGDGGTGTGGVGGKGGTGGAAGAGGAGGIITLKSVTGNIYSDFDIYASGGVGYFGATGGNGGNGSFGGGVGGTGGRGGNSGAGGKITCTSPSTITVGGGGVVMVQGGPDIPPVFNGGDGGSGGDATVLGSGGRGGNAGNGGNGSNGGSIVMIGGFFGSVDVEGRDINGTFYDLDASGYPGAEPGLPGVGGFDNTNTFQAPDGNFGLPGSDGFGGSIFITQEETSDDDNPWKKRKSNYIASRNGEENHFRAVSYVEPMLTVGEKKVAAHNCIVAPDGRAVITRAGDSLITVEPGATALVASSKGLVSVLALHENHSDDIVVKVADQNIKLHAGDQVIVSDDSTKSFEDANPFAGVAIRGVKEHIVGNKKIFVCEFSIVSALQKVSRLQELTGENADGKAIYNDILKTAAALHVVTAVKGPYVEKWKSGQAKSR